MFTYNVTVKKAGTFVAMVTIVSVDALSAMNEVENSYGQHPYAVEVLADKAGKEASDNLNSKKNQNKTVKVIKDYAGYCFEAKRVS